MKSLLNKIKTTKKLQVLIGIIILILAFIIYSIFTSYSLENRSTSDYINSNNSEGFSITDDIDNDEYTEDINEVETKNSNSSSKNFVSSDNKNQKLVYSGNININSDDIDETYSELINIMNKYKGKIENINESNGYKSIFIRVKKDNFMDLYDSIKEISGDITDASLNIDDKTKAYSNNSRKIDALQAEYDDLKNLMKDAKNIEEILTIKDRLSELAYQLDELEESNKNIDYDSNYSNLYVTIEKSSTVYNIPFYKQIKEAFHDSLYLIKGFILFLIRIWWIIAIILILIYRKNIKKLFKKNKKLES